MPLAKYKDLKHIPGDRGNIITGRFFKFLSNATGLWSGLKKKYGDVYYLRILHRNQVVVGGIDTTKKLLVEEAKNTENKEAWETSLSDLFPNSLMLLDGAEHKYHRSIMLDAFKKNAIQGYLTIMPKIITEKLDEINEGKNLMFPFYKMLTLNLATRVFFGLDETEDLEKINNAITDIVKASAALPINLPFTKLRAGINGRKYLKSVFERLVPERRKNPGDDLFSKFCLAENEEGDKFNDDEIIDHLIFVLMAAHDTTAITLTWMSYFIALYPEWQEKLRDETKDIDTARITSTELRDLNFTSFVLKETLRIHPPLTMVVRKLTKEMTISDQRLPLNTLIACVFQLSHLDERVWSEPEKFDPLRFSKERKEHMKCPYAYSPFGAGQHHCIGYSFAELQIKLVIIELLKKYELSLSKGYKLKIQDVPLKQPKDDLPVILKQYIPSQN